MLHSAPVLLAPVAKTAQRSRRGTPRCRTASGHRRICVGVVTVVRAHRDINGSLHPF
jgi:hypothetical protein